MQYRPELSEPHVVQLCPLNEPTWYVFWVNQGPSEKQDEEQILAFLSTPADQLLDVRRVIALAITQWGGDEGTRSLCPVYIDQWLSYETGDDEGFVVAEHPGDAWLAQFVSDEVETTLTCKYQDPAYAHMLVQAHTLGFRTENGRPPEL